MFVLFPHQYSQCFDFSFQLNMLANEIMDFVTEVGKMLFTEKDEVCFLASFLQRLQFEP